MIISHRCDCIYFHQFIVLYWGRDELLGGGGKGVRDSLDIWRKTCHHYALSNYFHKQLVIYLFFGVGVIHYKCVCLLLIYYCLLFCSFFSSFSLIISSPVPVPLSSYHFPQLFIVYCYTFCYYFLLLLIIIFNCLQHFTFVFFCYLPFAFIVTIWSLFFVFFLARQICCELCV